MDPATSTLIATSIGGVLVLLTTWLNNYFTSNRESKQWNRQQEADRNKRRHEEKVNERNRRREVFQNALTQLSTLNLLEKDSLTNEEQTRRIEETQKWLNLLALTYPANKNEKKPNFHSVLEDFNTNPFFFALQMRFTVLKLSQTDTLLFPGAGKETEVISSEETKRIMFQIKIDDDFRRQHLIQAVEIPQSANFSCDLSDLTTSQRELLANIYYPS